jgi:integrase
MLDSASRSHSPHIFPALLLALNAGMRDAEIRRLQWSRLDFDKRFLTVGKAKTAAGRGRTIPLNFVLFPILWEYARRYKEKSAEIQAH